MLVIRWSQNPTWKFIREIELKKTFKSATVSLSKGKGKAAPSQAPRGPERSTKLRFPDFMTTAQDVGKFVSFKHWPPLPPGNAPGTHFYWKLGPPQDHSAIGRILCQWKIPMAPTGIEPTAFRFVARRLNHFPTAVPRIFKCSVINTTEDTRIIHIYISIYIIFGYQVFI